MTAIRYRRAQTADATGIARVHVDSWRTTYPGIVSAEVLDRLSDVRRAAFWQHTLSDPNDRSRTVVAETEDHEIVGFASGGPERDGIDGFSAELYAIYILEEEQGRGVGRRLVRRVAEGLLQDGHSAMLVWILAENPFRRFYEALGGHRIATKQITIGPDELEEIAYGWNNLESLESLIERLRQ